MYNWLFIENESGLYTGWSNSVAKPLCNEPDKWHFVAWGKTLPEDTEQEMFYSDGNLIDSAGKVIPLPEVESESAE